MNNANEYSNILQDISKKLLSPFDKIIGLPEKIRSKLSNISPMDIFRYLRGTLTSLIKFQNFSIINQHGPIKVQKNFGDISIGNHSILWDNNRFSAIGISEEKPAKIKIGKWTAIGERTEIHARQSVTIGNECRISWDVVILDRDYHGWGNNPEVVKPVVIEDHAWLGCKSTILKGVTVGHHSIVGAGAVVFQDVPPYSIVSGNPAKVIKMMDPKDWC